MSALRFFAEIRGGANGVCAGRGGSIHVAGTRVGAFGAGGIVGGWFAARR